MSEAKGQNNKRPNDQGAGPTRSFDGSVTGPGSQIGPFRIERELGRGAVGVVYLAHDTKLDRSVAIKSLPAEVMANPKARSRFSREAKLLASVNHPNIATIHEVLEEAEGVGYLILEYVPGQTLAERIAKSGFKLEESLSIALQIAEAVAAAHEHDVIHRDLKPGNIKITPEGKVKVLDFGLAKAVGGEAADQQSTVTEPGRIIGTPAYMSPEQARGKPTDKRSDIWSFGCVLYEMLSGRIPFKGETISDTLANILDRDPNWQAMPDSTPANIVALLRRCLEKEPRRRVRDIGDIAITLEDTTIELQHPTLRTRPVETGRAKSTKWSRRALPWFITGAAVTILVFFGFIIGLKLGSPAEKQVGEAISLPPAKPIKAIVVLPFENLSGDPEQEYFVDGMRDALGAELGKISALTVKGQHSAARYKRTAMQTPDIAKELGVDAVITGSVFKVANNVRITAQLMHGPTEENLWADSYEGDLADVLTLQREVALAIAKEIKVKLTPQEEEHLASARPINPQAHDAYLKGRFFLNKRSEEGLKTAISFFEQAKDLDPNYALAYVGLADCHLLQGMWAFAPPQEVFPKAKAEAEQALEIDDTLGEAHTSLAYAIASHDWDWSEAERQFLRAIELSPNYATAHHWYAVFLTWMGRFDEALVVSERAQELDPLSLIIRSEVGQSLSYVGRHGESIEQLREVLQMDPDFLPALCYLANTNMRRSMPRESPALLERVAAIRRRDVSSVAWLAFTHATVGNTREAQTLLQEVLDRSERGEHVQVGTLSQLYAALGDKEQAFKLLDEVIEGDRWSAVTLIVDPKWDPLRSDPRFDDALQQMDFPETPVAEPVAEPIDAAQTPIEKIAVLPFTSISSESGEEWFVDGMTDALITQLGKIKALTVISRTSAMQYKNISKPMREIAQDLGVDVLVEGSVIRAGNDVQVTARLIDGRTDERIWGDFFQGTFGDILALQSQVTLAIARQIEAALTPEEEVRITRTKLVNPEAHEAFLKGRFFYFKFTEEGFKLAVEYLEKAIEIDPNYAEPHAWASLAQWVPSIWGYSRPSEGFSKARLAANNAVNLDKTLAMAHVSVGWIALAYDWDWKKAKESFERARELNPNDPEAYQGLATYFARAGRFDEAIETMQTAVKLDPLSHIFNNSLASTYLSAGQVEQAIEQRKKALELAPDSVIIIDDLADDYLSMSRYSDAVATIEKSMSLAGRTPRVMILFGRAYALSGRKDEIETLLEELQEKAASEYVLPVYFARLYASLGDMDRAFQWLEKAQQERDWSMLLLKTWPPWDPLRSDPRFDDLVQRMGFPE